MAKKMPPVHPGEILLEEFLLPMKLSQNALAHGIGVPSRRINEIVHDAPRITADISQRLGRFFRTSPERWLGPQMDYDLETESDRLKAVLRKQSASISNWGNEHQRLNGEIALPELDYPQT